MLAGNSFKMCVNVGFEISLTLNTACWTDGRRLHFAAIKHKESFYVFTYKKFSQLYENVGNLYFFRWSITKNVLMDSEKWLQP